MTGHDEPDAPMPPMTAPAPMHQPRAGLGNGAKQVSLELRDLTKSYGPILALDNVSLVTEPGEFITFLGPSGSGKTTTLNLIAGFLTPDRGEIFVDGRPISGIPPHRRNIGLVFQNYLLFPHMSAHANIAFPLRRRKMPTAEIERKVGEVLELVGLEGLGARYPRELSGGQQQRVALARSIVFNPPLLLMDEPLGALDKNLRESLQVEMRRIHRELGTTFLYVTHDQGEALALSDRIAVFRDGRIEQLGTTTEVYESPTTTFVASFIGESNLLRGTVSRAGPSERMLTSGPWRLALPRTAPVGGEVTLLLRPEKVRLGGEAGPGNSVRGRVIESVYLGASRRVLVEVQGFGVMTVYETGGGDQVVEPGQEVDVTWAVEDAVVLPEPHSSGEAEEDTGRDG